MIKRRNIIRLNFIVMKLNQIIKNNFTLNFELKQNKIYKILKKYFIY